MQGLLNPCVLPRREPIPPPHLLECLYTSLTTPITPLSQPTALPFFAYTSPSAHNQNCLTLKYVETSETGRLNYRLTFSTTLADTPIRVFAFIAADIRGFRLSVPIKFDNDNDMKNEGDRLQLEIAPNVSFVEAADPGLRELVKKQGVGPVVLRLEDAWAVDMLCGAVEMAERSLGIAGLSDWGNIVLSSEDRPGLEGWWRRREKGFRTLEIPLDLGVEELLKEMQKYDDETAENARDINAEDQQIQNHGPQLQQWQQQQHLLHEYQPQLLGQQQQQHLQLSSEVQPRYSQPQHKQEESQTYPAIQQPTTLTLDFTQLLADTPQRKILLRHILQLFSDVALLVAQTQETQAQITMLQQMVSQPEGVGGKEIEIIKGLLMETAREVAREKDSQVQVQRQGQEQGALGGSGFQGYQCQRLHGQDPQDQYQPRLQVFQGSKIFQAQAQAQRQVHLDGPRQALHQDQGPVQQGHQLDHQNQSQNGEQLRHNRDPLDLAETPGYHGLQSSQVDLAHALQIVQGPQVAVHDIPDHRGSQQGKLQYHEYWKGQHPQFYHQGTQQDQKTSLNPAFCQNLPPDFEIAQKKHPSSLKHNFDQNSVRSQTVDRQQQQDPLDQTLSQLQQESSDDTSKLPKEVDVHDWDTEIDSSQDNPQKKINKAKAANKRAKKKGPRGQGRKRRRSEQQQGNKKSRGKAKGRNDN